MQKGRQGRMDTLIQHWTQKSIDDFVYRISSDFVVQLEKRLEQLGLTHKKLAKVLDVSEGRVSQVFNNPGNLTLTSTVQYARAGGMKVAIVAYDDGDPKNNTGPVSSEIFNICWKNAGSPRSFFALRKDSQRFINLIPTPTHPGTRGFDRCLKRGPN
jgi:hypothetical protein